MGFVHVFSKGFGGYKSGDQRYFEAVNRRETTQWLRGKRPTGKGFKITKGLSGSMTDKARHTKLKIEQHEHKF